LEDLGLEKRIIMIGFLKTFGGRLWIKFIRLRIAKIDCVL
jgi:hypothetical protein